MILANGVTATAILAYLGEASGAPSPTRRGARPRRRHCRGRVAFVGAHRSAPISPNSGTPAPSSKPAAPPSRAAAAPASSESSPCSRACRLPGLNQGRRRRFFLIAPGRSGRRWRALPNLSAALPTQEGRRRWRHLSAVRHPLLSDLLRDLPLSGRLRRILPWVPRTVDRGHEVVGLTHGSRDVFLIALFGLRRGVVARQGFKRRRRAVPAAPERSPTCSSPPRAHRHLLLSHPVPTLIWGLETGFRAYALWALFGLGSLIVLVSTFLLGRFDCSACTRSGPMPAARRSRRRSSARRFSTGASAIRSTPASSSLSGRRRR